MRSAVISRNARETAYRSAANRRQDIRLDALGCPSDALADSRPLERVDVNAGEPVGGASTVHGKVAGGGSGGVAVD